MKEHSPTLSGTIIDDAMELTLDEVCRACATHAEMITRMVEEGILEPRGSEPATWQFPGTALRRIQITVRLQRDLQIDLGGVALAVDLLEEIHELRARVRTLESRILER